MTTTWTQEQIDSCVSRLELDGTKVSTVVEGRAFINGTYVATIHKEWLPTTNPATNRVVAQIAACQEADVNVAVSAARAAFDSGVWSHKKSPTERKDILLQFAALIQEHTLELAVLDSVEAGKIIRDNLQEDVPGTAQCFRYHAEAVDKLYDQVAPTAPNQLGLILREPVGVVGLIVPWNFLLKYRPKNFTSMTKSTHSF